MSKFYLTMLPPLGNNCLSGCFGRSSVICVASGFWTLEVALA